MRDSRGRKQTKAKEPTNKTGGDKMANEKNLIPIHTRPDHKELSSKGGRANAERIRQQKQLRQTIEDLLTMPIKKGTVEEFHSIAEAQGKNMTAQDAMILAVMRKAMEGDVQALTFLRDTAGQKPVDKQEVKGSVQTAGKLDSILQQLKKHAEE